jgi:hypothetical protein
MKSFLFGDLPWLVLLAAAQSAQATLYHSEVDFLAAFPTATLVDFDTLPANTMVSGGRVSGVGFLPFVTDPFGVSHQLMTVGDSPSRSSNNSIGTDDANNFYGIQAGTPLSFTFDMPMAALGMFFLTPDPMVDGDILLNVGTAATAELSVGARELLVSDFEGAAWYAYFLGVSSATPFTTASVGYGPGAAGVAFLFTLDDLRYEAMTVPEPPTLAYWLAGGVGIARFTMGRRRSVNRSCA